MARKAKTCKCGKVKGTNKCRKTIKKGPNRGSCRKRPRR